MTRPAKNNSLILGIDPGSHFCGYGIIDSTGAYVASGRIVLSGKDPLHNRLKDLHEGLMSVLSEFSPSVAAVEKVFYAASIRSALTLGHARGVVLQALSSRGLEIFEYSPLEVKKSITGYGRAEKSQVQAMITAMLGIRHKVSSDSADALALAVCHRHQAWFSPKRSALIKQ